MQKLLASISFLLLFISPCLAQPAEMQGLSKISWIFSENDFNSEIKDESIKKGKYTVEIVRQFSNENERALIRKAEALYPKESELNPIEVNPSYNPSDEDKPYWSRVSFGGVKVTRIVSTRAILYYQGVSAALRNKQKVTEAKMASTDLSYTATVQHYDEYEAQGNKLKNVDIVILKLGWSQNCGSSCGMTIKRRKIVIFNSNSEPLALFIDAFGGFSIS